MSDYDLKGKVALIIGASRGIGAATAQAFLREGVQVVLAARDVDAMHQLTLSVPAAGFRIAKADLTIESDLQNAVQLAVREFGRLDIAVNNGGVSQQRAPFADLSNEAFDLSMNTNARGVFIAMKHQIKAMLAGNCGGAIVNTGSISSLVAMPQMGAYMASKHALVGLTKSAALDYAAHNIRVNLIAPGAVDTSMTRKGVLATEQGRNRIESITPMGRVSEPQEIADAILWLCSPRASFVTGTVFPVDGGYTLP
jgi:NAD(P)-dependent dehydrogenase (short-subunit alcohol dehydrogenase family)